MASLAFFLTLLIGLIGVSFVVGVAGALLLRYVESHSTSDHPAMPSHYSSLLHVDPTNYPGYCPECGESNGPEFSVCQNCSSRLPTQGRERGDTDLETIIRP